MVTRELREGDLERCSEIYKKVFSKAPWNEDWDIEIAHKRLSHFFNSECFVGVVTLIDGVIIGFALGNIEPFLHGDIFYLREMCVLPGFQNKGLGTNIICELENSLSRLNIKSIYLFTDRKIPAVKFYLKQGYKHDKDFAIFTKDVSFYIIGRGKNSKKLAGS